MRSSTEKLSKGYFFSVFSDTSIVSHSNIGPT
eukprot:CCRYP_014858-RA/>CCRYP_014858-RA protein AED:0.00 eAED:0.00 QI:97/1/1/1/0/0/2/24/31